MPGQPDKKKARANTAGKSIPVGQVQSTSPSTCSSTPAEKHRQGQVQGQGQGVQGAIQGVLVGGQLKSMAEVIGEIYTRLNKLAVIEKSLEWIEGEMTDLKHKVETTVVKCDQVVDKITRLQNENTDLKQFVKGLQTDIEDLQCRSMSENLLFAGVEDLEKIDGPKLDVPENSTEVILKIIEDKMEIPRGQIGIERAHRIGRPRRGHEKPRTIVVKFRNLEDKKRVLKNGNKLKGTNIFVNEQFPRSVEEKRKKLRPILKQAKTKGKNAWMVRDKLYIDGQLYEHRNITDLGNEMVH
jgi:hypothetical protein